MEEGVNAGLYSQKNGSSCRAGDHLETHIRVRSHCDRPAALLPALLMRASPGMLTRMSKSIIRKHFCIP